MEETAIVHHYQRNTSVVMIANGVLLLPEEPPGHAHGESSDEALQPVGPLPEPDRLIGLILQQPQPRLVVVLAGHQHIHFAVEHHDQVAFGEVVQIGHRGYSQNELGRTP